MQELLSKVESEIAKRNISQDEISEALKDLPQFTNRRIIGGYSSVAIMDREGQRIPISALKNAVKDFMDNPYARNVMVFHSDVQVGRVLPKWTNPDTGEIFETKVDDKGWFCIVEIRDDVEIADKVWDEIIKGNLRSFSIAGSAKKKENKMEMGQSIQDVLKLEIYETTICAIPVNSMSIFDILYQPGKVSI